MPTQLQRGEGRCPMGRNEHVHHRDRRGKGFQAPGERLAELTSGRAYFQQGLATTCKDWHSEREQGVAEDLGLAHEPVGAKRVG
jgi:hypothetical protein